jgi:hypothetical protein
VSELIEVANRFPTERTHITTKGDIHEKSTEQAGKGEDTATEIAM